MLLDQEKFLYYPPYRDVVFMMGAGTSRPDGVPLQRDILPKILSGEVNEISSSEIGKTVVEFINDNFVYDISTNQYPRLEAIFGFIDYFIQNDESLSAKYSNAQIRVIKEYLIKIIHYIVDLRTDKESKYYHLFWERINKYNRNISIISLNYDTLLEQAFNLLFKKFGYLDFCIPLMNYDKRKEMKAFGYWVNPREPVTVGENEDPVPIKLIKIHGSLNWKYCNCCNQTLLTTWDRKIDLQKGKLVGYTYDKKVYEYQCPLDGTDFQTLIMPPSYVKSLTNPVISQLISEAAREIRSTNRIVFIGYSLSDADVHIKALLKKQIDENVEIVVINTRGEEKIRWHYESLSKKIKFIQKSFEDLVEDESLMQQILTQDPPLELY
ncbi:MAG: SIR2 family protein [Melioribacteraceae bacterium]|nr:SIR2 family protein [Melioribacteraceae bacterium]MCF8356994.1 SIR2 family protein [Melioribacteraceae bacterium]MCF8396455.1 SIR2 family protein [Melioribacteraceae bacterium]